MKDLKYLLLATAVLFTNNSVFAQDDATTKAAFNLFADYGVNLEYSSDLNVKPKFSIIPAIKATWTASVTKIQIVDGTKPVFPATANTYFIFETPVKLIAEADLQIISGIFNRIKGQDKIDAALNAATITASLKGTVTSDGVTKFIDSCFVDPKKETKALVAKSILLGLEAFAVYNKSSTSYNISIDLLVTSDQVIVTESVYSGEGKSIFTNSNIINMDTKPYLRKIYDMTTNKKDAGTNN